MLALSMRRVSMAQARRWRQKAESISSTRPSSTLSAGWKRATNSDWMESKASRDSLPRTTILAMRPWRVAFWAERAFPAGVIGPLERAPLALEEIVRRNEDICAPPFTFYDGGGGVLYVSRLGSIS